MSATTLNKPVEKELLLEIHSPLSSPRGYLGCCYTVALKMYWPAVYCGLGTCPHTL